MDPSSSVPGPGAAAAVNISPVSQAALWGACIIFTLQAFFHWCRAACVSPNARVRQHELLAAAATELCSLLYMAMATGISKSLYVAGPGQSRVFYGLQYAERAVAVGIVLVNVGALARERRSPVVALATVWATQTGALYFGNLVSTAQRPLFLCAAGSIILPLALLFYTAMGERLHLSWLQAVYRLLSTWIMLCGLFYCFAFLLSAVNGLLDSETELLAYMVLDYCVVGISCLVISWAGPDLEAPLLPAQEAELSLYPGPHTHGFFPNPDYYDDNL